eukprot:CAMPEP_0118803672 /NCGR_PEP_ID=MMETSP1161-20130426/18595_1 /TAXON_ID=249345 /ORGANISM="Picochlorum oklahomensis, Strain CCMP2329" /LENGTH=56 /DNA_ID=CAMNT_0006732237 /DNA_START=1 /DNA_END=168 /DNA_ORIENTATION=+
MRIRNPEYRQRAFLKLCQPKRVDLDGNPQPSYRLVPGTMTIMADHQVSKKVQEMEG